MKAILIVALALTAVCAIDVNSNLFTKHEQQSLAQIKNSNWANFIINYSELHLQTGGALQDLLKAIEELLVDLQNELDKITKDFARRTDNHNRDVARLELEIADADRDIWNTNDLIDNVLLPQRDRFSNQLKQLKANIAQNRKSLQEETATRNKQHDEFVSRLAEHNEALEAVDECLQLLNTITNPSLAQIQTFQTNVKKIEKKLSKKSEWAPLVKALVALASEQNFADQGALKNIVKALGDLRVNLVDSINQETADENAAQATFNERVDQLNSEHADFQRQVLFKNAELTRTEEKIVTSSEYLRVRKNDCEALKNQLQAENDNYAQETDIFNNLKAEYLHEIDCANQAYALLTQPSFEAYVKQNLGF